MDALFIIAETWKQPRRPSTGERIDHGNPDSGILFSAKKKCTIKPCTVRHGRKLNAYYQVKEVNLKRLYTL